MRIATWNCARGPLAVKRAALDKCYAADVVVLTEASPPAADDTDVLWFGDGRFGVAIYARRPFAVREATSSRAIPCVYPVIVTGPIRFTLFGVWTWPAPTYKSAFLAGLDRHRRVRGPSVFAGDFNGNLDFDKPRSRSKWSDCFDRLASKGLISAYHRGKPTGKERDATHYFQWKENRRFHLDYCFVPGDWKVRSVTIGSYSEWASLSDHRPVVVDVDAV